MTILSVLNELAATRSRLEKERILKDALADRDTGQLLSKVFDMAYDPYTNFFMRKVDLPDSNVGAMTLNEALDEINNTIATRELTGNHAKAFVKSVLMQCTEEDAEVVKRVILRNLKCGVSTSLFNKVCDTHQIATFACMLAKPFSPEALDKLTPPYVVQLKSDGSRCCALVDASSGKVTYHTREGNKYLIDVPEIDEIMLSVSSQTGSVMIDGEMVLIDDDGICDRQKSNGIVNKAIGGTISKEECDHLRFYVWDCVPMEAFEAKTYSVPYHARHYQLITCVGADASIDGGSHVEVSPTHYVETLDEVLELGQQYISAGEEGVVVKSYDLKWEDKRTPKMLKFKEEHDCDLLVTGFTHGDENKGFHEGIGTLQCASSCGNLTVSVYSGLSAAQRGYVKDDDGNYVFDPAFDLEQYTGRIVKVTYNTKIKRKDSDGYKLFCPRIVAIRDDKDEADSEKDIK